MAEVDYTARFILPHMIERARANLIQCPVYRDGALVSPSSGTITLYDPTATAVVSAQAITVTGSIAEYSVSALTTYAYADGWVAEWSLVMPDGVTHVFRNDAALVYASIHPPATDADLFRRASSLDPSGAAITTLSDYQDYLDEAWADIWHTLAENGREPWRIINANGLRRAHVLQTLALVFSDLASRNDAAFMEQALDYRQQAKAAMTSAKLLYDRSDQGVGDSSRKIGARQPGFWLA